MPRRDRQAYNNSTTMEAPHGQSLPKPRTLVLCFDGTSNEYDADNTNVVKLFALLKKDDFEQQLCYYQAGVGTWFEPGVVSPLFHWGAKMLDLAVAWYLDNHVMEGYRFLMDNYRTGDRICIFGFSRGAYTARALGGFLYKAGLLPRGNQAQVPFAYKLYKREDKEGIELCAGFKQTYCQDVKIEFMGVWDTVSSVGVFIKRTLPFTNSNRSVKTFRHALALDERRVKFQPNYYHRPTPKEDDSFTTEQVDHRKQGSSDSSTLAEDDVPHCQFFGRIPSKRSRKLKKKLKRAQAVKDLYSTAVNRAMVNDDSTERLGPVDDVLEVWFAGCHSDVGGGSVHNSQTQNLGNISLRWMVREILASGCGILFDLDAMARANIRVRLEPSASELILDDADALQDIHDELKRRKAWWLLEILPLHHTWQDAKGVWRKNYGINLGRGRKIPDPEPKFHITVQKRMRSHLDYRPQARWFPGSEIYVF
ncbi:hypothetical protein CC1G_03365 [Coprinopsis cinerea okayama7|uniref:T6SS Phospholipase effector Tle1-like catalytic domain-containing protein n=1 Tax=Coprinopsis cinerea (strain Okayama-7 / 130 / ATCC MYA-4618 / FGSC 9003) TaxID=240176 RepID=A8NQZ3_COPC7|nr:hypothetical protein CC1G_03365 [Coprinopsis cinerea okayama7\|eukprot:XP_001835583.2 hypothetical protein CC1G_03365 [Coprinopsis cinerea okayama7\